MYKKYLWISHSAINAFERCPQSYYYQYQYKNPETGNRIQIVNPYFSLGLSVHQTIEELGSMSVEERLKVSLKDRFEEIWSEYSGKQGGFVSKKHEKEFKDRGEMMIDRVVNSDFLEKPSTEIKETVPSIDLIPEEDIKLVGSLDWIRVMEDGSYHIIDFKTGKNKEKKGSLQLPIYNILANKKLDGEVKKFSYWYLNSDDKLTPREFGSTEESLKIIKEKALEIKDHVENNNYPCHYNGKCFACGDYNKIFNGEAEFLGTDPDSGKDLYFVINEDDIVRKLIDREVFDQKEEKVFELRMDGKQADRIKKELRMPSDKIKKIISSIKGKMVKELSSKEVRILVNKKLK
ncbi:MAG: RecB family exonuclease [Patescibacteria group bacterium]